MVDAHAHTMTVVKKDITATNSIKNMMILL